MKSTSASPLVRLTRKLPAYCRVVFADGVGDIEPFGHTTSTFEEAVDELPELDQIDVLRPRFDKINPNFGNNGQYEPDQHQGFGV